MCLEKFHIAWINKPSDCEIALLEFLRNHGHDIEPIDFNQEFDFNCLAGFDFVFSQINSGLFSYANDISKILVIPIWIDVAQLEDSSSNYKDTIFPPWNYQELCTKMFFLKKLMQSSLFYENEISFLNEKLNFLENFKVIVDKSSNAAYIANRNGIILYANPTFLEVSGYSLDEIIGYKVSILRSGYHTKEFYNNLWSTVLSGQEWHGTIYNKKKSGEFYWDETHITPKVNKDNTIEGFLAIKYDKTEWKRIIQSLKESEEKMRNIVAFSDIGIAMANGSGRIESANNYLARITGFSTEKLIEKNLFELIFDDNDQNNDSSHYLNDFKNDTLLIEKLFTKNNADQIWIKIKLSKIIGEDGVIKYFIGIFEDVTMQKQYEAELLSMNDILLSTQQKLQDKINIETKIKEELKNAKDEIDSAYQIKSNFLANMSHEIRTPLNAILGFAEILIGQITSQVHRNYLQSIRTSGKNLLNLLNDILDFSKIESGKLIITPEPVKIRAIAEELQNIYAFICAQKELRYETIVSPEVFEYLLLDEVRIRQVVLNLLGNAIKFTERGYVRLKISAKNNLSQSKSKNFQCSLIIEVEDTGIGISQENIQKIFEPFKQAGQESKKYGGTGLGLSITKQLTAMMNGTISVESNIGVGSTFTVTLYEVPIIDPPLIASKNLSYDQIENIRFEKSTILLVDDHEESRIFIKRFLNDSNLRILEAQDGIEAVLKAKSIRPDLILMDIFMPIMNGIEISKQIRLIPALSTIPIIAVSISQISEIGENKNIFDGFVQKPIQKDELLGEMIKHLRYTFENPIESQSKQNLAYFKNIIFNKTSNEALNLLLNEIKPAVQNVSISGSFEKYSYLGQVIFNFGEKFEIEFLKTLGQEFTLNAESFDIEKLNAGIRQLFEFITNFEYFLSKKQET